MRQSPLFARAGGRACVFRPLLSCAAGASESICWPSTDYHEPVTAIVGRGNVYGMQFHPEKSGELGMRLLGQFFANDAQGTTGSGRNTCRQSTN